MPSWDLRFEKAAEDDLASLDREIRRRIIDKLDWLVKNFNKIRPLPLGEPWKGLFKLRVGDWRIVYEIKFSEKLIRIHYIDRRDKIYKRKV